MINKSSELCTRRILSFPAIRPSESVSFPTLLTSLIALCHSICNFKSKPFFTNKKNAKISIHLIQTLLVFLEEIMQNKKDSRFLESPVHLCLSELHFIFQKINFLLEDCTRDNSRLWLLMQPEKVSSLFREQIRAITVALDVLPLSEFEISDEVKELVDFVRKQALKSNFEVERDDKRAMRRVLRIIDKFEAGIAPESFDLKRVLEYIRIKTWNECNNEITFLQNPTRDEIETNEKKDVRFLSSLTAFLIYCRCIAFENVGSVRNNIDASQQYDKIGFLNPDDFRCPISLEIMTDPVTISTGHTYDRFWIGKWFKSGNHTCPKTGGRLISVDLIPNLALKRLVKLYCQENGIPSPGESGGHFRHFIKSLDSARSLAAEQAMAMVARFLVGKVLAGKSDERNKACREIRLLTETSVFNQSCLVDANAIPPVLNLARSKNQETQENSMAALLNLSKHVEGKGNIVKNRGLDVVFAVLNGGVKMETRGHAAGVLFYLASVEEYGKTIGGVPGAITGLMDLIRSGPVRAKRIALAAVSGLLVCPENHRRVLSAGLVLMLVNMLTNTCEQAEEVVVTDSLVVLAALAEKIEGAMAIVSAGALPAIIKTLGCCDYFTKEQYVTLLLALCINDGADVVPVLVRDASLMVDLYSVLADGSSRSSKMAGSLIGILHAFDEKISPSGSSTGSDFRREHFVHVW